jgi:ABC-type branched-subunit amino acid transport system substrate-binding protein
MTDEGTTTTSGASLSGRLTGSHVCRRAVVLLGVLAAAVALTACSSTASQSASSTGRTSTSGSSRSSIPASAFADATGLTATKVLVGNVSTLSGGLFKGALIGTQAYADYVNSRGGIDGRSIAVDSYDDGFTGALNKQFTTEAADRDFALVGGFSLEDSFGGTVLAANADVPNVTNPLDHATALLSNTVGPQVSNGGWGTGGLEYFRQRYPAASHGVADLVANQPSAIASWQIEKGAMEHVGLNVVYAQQYAITQTDFNANVIAMRNAGVKMLFLDQMPENYAASVLRALDQQNFHPIVILGTSTYSEELVRDSGGAAAADGSYMILNSALFLGEDASGLPAVSTFLTWVHKAAPGFTPDLFTLYGWTSAELFADALASAGPHPTRGALLRELHKVNSFNANGMIVTSDPSSRSGSNCFLIARVESGRFERFGDPPIAGRTGGYICSGGVYFPKS